MKTQVTFGMFALCYLLVIQNAAAAVQKISPELQPVSSKKFFDKDYPNDERAVADKHYVFDHPYPAVQDSSDYDRDYVKDENSDGGRWEAQMHYDTLRAEIRKAKDLLDKLKAKMEEEYKEWQEAKDKKSDHMSELEKARAAVEAAKKAAEEAAKRVNELEGRAQKPGTGVGGAIGDAIKDVQKEMKDLEDCKEALAKAKKKLKELLEQQAKEEEIAAKDEAERKAAEEAARKATEEAAKKEDEEAKKAGSNGKKSAAEEEEEAKKEIATDETKTADWRKQYEKELADVKLTEKQLEEAAKTLRKYRRPPYVDNDGGVYDVPKSFAAKAGPAGLVAIIFAMAMC